MCSRCTCHVYSGVGVREPSDEHGGKEAKGFAADENEACCSTDKRVSIAAIAEVVANAGPFRTTMIGIVDPGAPITHYADPECARKLLKDAHAFSTRFGSECGKREISRNRSTNGEGKTES